MVQENGWGVFSIDKYISFQSLLKLWGTAQLAILIFVFFISVFKPWRKNRINKILFSPYKQ